MAIIHGEESRSRGLATRADGKTPLWEAIMTVVTGPEALQRLKEARAAAPYLAWWVQLWTKGARRRPSFREALPHDPRASTEIEREAIVRAWERAIDQTRLRAP
jgi:hypothetical protein